MVLVKIRYFFIVLSLGKTGKNIIHLEDFTGDENIVFDFLDVYRLGQSRYFV